MSAEHPCNHDKWCPNCLDVVWTDRRGSLCQWCEVQVFEIRDIETEGAYWLRDDNFNPDRIVEFNADL